MGEYVFRDAWEKFKTQFRIFLTFAFSLNWSNKDSTIMQTGVFSMSRGRKPEERSIVAGIRFKRAIKIFGKSIRTLIDDLRWEELVKIFDEKTIRTWIKNGIPLSKLSNVSQFFGVPGHILSDEKINEEEFDKIIHDSKFLMDNPDADIPVLKRPKEKDESSIDQILSDLSELVAKWFHKGCPYGDIENNYKKFKLCFNDLEFIKDVEDDKIDLYLLGCSLHSGKNWAYWVKRNLKNDAIIKYLVQVMNDINYDRPRLRILYALQQFPQNQVLEYLEDVANPAVIQILEEYVIKKRVVEFILSQREIIPQKANQVLKELVHLWGEQVPGFGLFGVSQSSFSKLERIKMIDKPTSKELLNISKKPGMHTPVVDFLMKAMSKPDPYERYWVYITLGLIGSDRAKALVEEGLTDRDKLARSGAERAMDIMNEKPDSKGGKNEKEE
jgi:HEAT repeats